MESKSKYRAEAKFIIASPYKIRPVADLVRLKSYPEAMALLESMPHRGARLVRKTVKSAASNALNLNKKLDEDMLYVKEVTVDEGPRMKRIWFRARGRADMLLKRLCHITVVIDETSAAGKKRSPAKAAK
ncbi:MAG: 50S ribosomal protein L22 [Treponema sp.]|jgi:large subunit ribosomal protein L22|nr:50S ribosomal protein L22 [Treponema sp.]